MSLRQQMRQESWPTHQIVEGLWTRKGQFADRQSYERWLRRLLWVHQSLGVPAAKLRPGNDELDLEYSRIEALLSDLNDPSLRDAEVDFSGPFWSVSFAWGVGYVLNGSTLGARFLLKRKTVKTEWPCAYLQQAASYVRSGRLKTYFGMFDALPLDKDHVSLGVEATFRAFEYPLNPSLNTSLLIAENLKNFARKDAVR